MNTRRKILLALLEVGAATTTSLQLLVNEDVGTLRTNLRRMETHKMVQKCAAGVSKNGQRYTTQYYILTREGIDEALNDEEIISSAWWVSNILVDTSKVQLFRAASKESNSSEPIVRYLNSVLAYAIGGLLGVNSSPLSIEAITEKDEEETEETKYTLAELVTDASEHGMEDLARKGRSEGIPVYTDAMVFKRDEVALLKQQMQAEESGIDNNVIIDTKRSQVKGFLETTDQVYAVYVVPNYGIGWSSRTSNIDQSMYRRYLMRKASSSIYNSMDLQTKYPALLIVKNPRDLAANVTGAKNRRRKRKMEESMQLGNGTSAMYVLPADAGILPNAVEPIMTYTDKAGETITGKERVAQVRKAWYDYAKSVGLKDSEFENPGERRLLPLVDENGAYIYLGNVLDVTKLYDLMHWSNNNSNEHLHIWCTDWEYPYFSEIFPNAQYTKVNTEAVENALSNA